MNTLLEVALSMAFVYSLLSILVTFLTEAWQRWRKNRGKLLKQSMDRLLNDPFNKNYSELLYEHPLVRGQRRSSEDLPAYISATTFVHGFLDLLRREAGEPRVFVTTDGRTQVEELPERDPFVVVKEGIASMAEGPLRTRLHSLLVNCPTLDDFRRSLAAWYTEYQEGTTESFKDKVRIKTTVAAAAVTLLMNVDSIQLFRQLYTDSALREVIVAEAEAWVKAHSDGPPAVGSSADSTDYSPEEDIRVFTQKMDSLRDYFEGHHLPLGWKCDDCATCAVAGADSGWTAFRKRTWDCARHHLEHEPATRTGERVLGYVFTMIALSFGAPFWFDLLNKLVSVRSGVRKKTFTETT